MNREFTRKQLYELVWSQPMRTIAANVGISDVALAKHCRKAHIPAPPRGYWARKQAGKPVTQIRLPTRSRVPLTTLVARRISIMAATGPRSHWKCWSHAFLF
jgi:hypothetical protein